MCILIKVSMIGNLGAVAKKTQDQIQTISGEINENQQYFFETLISNNTCIVLQRCIYGINSKSEKRENLTMHTAKR